jgi:hypothetical protein
MHTFNLEACVTPSTTPEEREMRKKTATTMVDNINNIELECSQLYNETIGVWKQLNEDMVQQEISQKIQTVQ